MSNNITLILVLLSGVLLGLFFFGGLWWTVQKGLKSDSPAAWFFGSLLLRTSVTLAGFCFLSRGDWLKLVVCLMGFVIARVMIMMQIKRATAGERAQLETGARSAH